MPNESVSDCPVAIRLERVESSLYSFFAPSKPFGSKKRADQGKGNFFRDVTEVAGASGTISHFPVGGVSGGGVVKCLFLPLLLPSFSVIWKWKVCSVTPAGDEPSVSYSSIQAGDDRKAQI